MNPLPLSAARPSGWRHIGATLALAASLGFAFQPTLLMAQSTEPDVPVQAKPKPKPAKKASKVMPSDTVADELNRREAERVTAAAQNVPSAKPAEAKPGESKAEVQPAPTPLPPRPPVVTAALTPTVGIPVSPPAAQPPATLVTPDPGAPAPQPRQAQARPPTLPVPIPPPSPGAAPAPPVVVGGAPGRPFAQSQVVPPQQPTLSLEVQKGTAIKLPGPASTVFVAAPDIADVQVKSPTMIYVFAKKPGDTVLYAVDDQDRVLLNTIVSVSSPVSRMKVSLDAQHPGNTVHIENQADAIVLSGTVRSALVAEDARKIALQHAGSNAKVINNIRVDAPNQVQLRVKIAEVKRDSLKRLGINWQNMSSIALFGLGIGRAGFATSTIQSVGGTATAAIGITSNDGSLTGLIDMLANQSQANILAEPNLVAMSGETASFLAGGEIPVISPQGGTLTNAITVVYKQVGVSLAFTPTIIGDRINLKVSPEVSQVTTEGQVSVPVGVGGGNIIIPAIQTRRASTTVELGSGQSFAIGGLMQHTSVQTISKVPWLGDVPVLGSLFKSDAYQRDESELVIIVTPYFVEPVSGTLRTPLSGRVPPTDVDRLVMQRFNHPTPPQRVTVGREQYSGPSAGFKLD